MLHGISWRDYLEAILFLLLLFYTILIAVFYRSEIKLLAERKWVWKNKPVLNDHEDGKEIPERIPEQPE